ncbi:MAG TPA: response regulator transcription factor, partial [Thermoleophilaceae bacterium]|nr:response regulator transcription factor [Thermoleophilaceae bacterium]
MATAVETNQGDVPIRGIAAVRPLRPALVSGDAAPAPAIRVLLADGQALVRAGVRLLLEVDERITVVGEAASGEETLALVAEIGPDVVMIDTRLPGLDSVETTRRIASEAGVAVMLLTAGESDERIFAALRAGASGLLPKDTQPTKLVQAIEALAQGEALLSPGLTRRLIDEFAARAEPASPDPELLDELTAREREVVALVALGLSNAEIAERLVVSPATAKTHVSRAMVKLRARDRAKLVVFAYEAGLVVARA